MCGFREKGLCATGDGCVPGTNPNAPEKLETFTKALGSPCLLLECAINKQVDHCTRCDKFPCRIRYRQGYPYSPKLLDMIKDMLGKA